MKPWVSLGGILIMCLGLVFLNLSHLFEVQSCQNVVTTRDIGLTCSSVPSPVLFNLVVPMLIIGFIVIIVGVFLKPNQASKSTASENQLEEIGVHNEISY